MVRAAFHREGYAGQGRTKRSASVIGSVPPSSPTTDRNSIFFR